MRPQGLTGKSNLLCINQPSDVSSALWLYIRFLAPPCQSRYTFFIEHQYFILNNEFFRQQSICVMQIIQFRLRQCSARCKFARPLTLSPKYLNVETVFFCRCLHTNALLIHYIIGLPICLSLLKGNRTTCMYLHRRIIRTT